MIGGLTAEVPQETENPTSGDLGGYPRDLKTQQLGSQQAPPGAKNSATPRGWRLSGHLWRGLKETELQTLPQTMLETKTQRLGIWRPPNRVKLICLIFRM